MFIRTAGHRRDLRGAAATTHEVAYGWINIIDKTHTHRGDSHYQTGEINNKGAGGRDQPRSPRKDPNHPRGRIAQRLQESGQPLPSSHEWGYSFLKKNGGEWAQIRDRFFKECIEWEHWIREPWKNAGKSKGEKGNALKKGALASKRTENKDETKDQVSRGVTEEGSWKAKEAADFPPCLSFLL